MSWPAQQRAERMSVQASRAVLTRSGAAERGADGAARHPYQE